MSAPKRKQGKIVGTRAVSTARKPHCSVHLTDKHMLSGPDGKWFCLACADEHLRTSLEGIKERNRQKGITGLIELPVGVKDPRIERATFRDVLPNRAARRAARRMT